MYIHEVPARGFPAASRQRLHRAGHGTGQFRETNIPVVIIITMGIINYTIGYIKNEFVKQRTIKIRN